MAQTKSAKSKASKTKKAVKRASPTKAGKAKIPLIAGGAALAGAASGIALNAARSGNGKVLGKKFPGRKRVKLRSKDLAKTADSLASFGEQVGAVSAGLRTAQEVRGNGDGAHNSPLEVLLQGLTKRR
jgi:hypothetical protein